MSLALEESMRFALPLLTVFGILCGPATAAPARPADAVEVFHCNFDASWDKNFDGWPNDWSRKRGRGYPHYVDLRIVEESPPGGGRSLCVRLDGGGAVAVSPPIVVSSLFEYVLEVQVRTEKLHHDRAYAAVVLLDAQHQTLRTITSETVRETNGWQTIRLGPVSIDGGARFAAVALHVEPGALEDLTGTVWFGDVWLGRLPRMRLESNEPHALFVLPTAVEVRCTISGSFTSPPEITFELEDAFGRILNRAVTRPGLSPVEAPGDVGGGPSLGEGVARWSPEIPGPGWYRARARLRSPSGARHDEQLTFAVMTPAAPAGSGEFGWSLPRGQRPLPLPDLARLLAQSGVRWVKYPLWLDEDESDERVQRLSAFAERLGSHGIEIIGLLGTPPDSLRERFGAPTAPAAELFTCDPKVWYPSIETTLTRMAMQVRAWQLGDDGDLSFRNATRLADRVGEIKAAMDRITQDTDLGFAWDWTRAFPSGGRGAPPWRFLALCATPPLSAEELRWYLDQPATPDVRRCVTLEPLAANRYDLRTRIIDLVERMVAAKICQADAIFAADPFAADGGVMNTDGTPGPLLLPWRITAERLSGATHLGSLTLPGGSRNDVFACTHGALIVVRNDRPLAEPFSLGPGARQTDLWGRETPLAAAGREHRVAVDALPSFLAGLSVPAARWQLDLQLERTRLPSVFDRPHANGLRLVNPFPRGVHGRVTIVAPLDWKIDPREATFNLARGETWRLPLEMLPPNTAGSGRHQLRFDFDLQADQPLPVSVYRFIDVGLGDVYVELSSRLDERGELEVTQRFVNETTTPVSFHCELFAPGRRLLKSQVAELGQGHDLQVYRLGSGKELIGQPLWLRAKEIGGPRVLNYRIAAQE